jgi:hypothetical protein
VADFLRNMRAAPFFIVRSPLLEAARIGGDPSAHLAVPAVREALRWASPSLLTAVTAEHRQAARDPDRPLTRYIERMAGFTAGVVEAGATEVRLSPRSAYRRILRADLDSVHGWLLATARSDLTSVAWCARLDIVWLADRLRVSTRSADGSDITEVDVERTPAIDAVLGAASRPVPFSALIDAATRHAARREEAAALVLSLVELPRSWSDMRRLRSSRTRSPTRSPNASRASGRRVSTRRCCSTPPRPNTR